MSGLQCEWVEIKNMIRKSSACLSTVNFIQKFVSLDSIVHQTDQASSEGVSEQMEVDSCLLIPTLLHLLNYTWAFLSVVLILNMVFRHTTTSRLQSETVLMWQLWILWCRCLVTLHQSQTWMSSTLTKHFNTGVAWRLAELARCWLQSNYSATWAANDRNALSKLHSCDSLMFVINGDISALILCYCGADCSSWCL